MIINTKYHDEVTVEQKEIITFEKGIPGFPEEREFVALNLSDEGDFKVLQSINHAEIAFLIVDPFQFFTDYQFELDQATIEELQLDQTKEKSIQVVVILTPKDPFESTTANLQAPIVINLINHKARQVILNDKAYSLRQPIFEKQAVQSKG